eukprot:TRINITY_DN4929_c0_g1_i3.p1 TRINITY_DN4929_c0_g1~~TRINITY_DN4929_c0_g1_i3.p1  ORF type:complete len:256 (+),score=29.98 TRINITY_DN4929_c0_g1_i3:163-930(+)
MLRSLVGSEMCIRDRVSTQSTGVCPLNDMAYMKGNAPPAPVYMDNPARTQTVRVKVTYPQGVAWRRTPAYNDRLTATAGPTFASMLDGTLVEGDNITYLKVAMPPGSREPFRFVPLSNPMGKELAAVMRPPAPAPAPAPAPPPPSAPPPPPPTAQMYAPPVSQPVYTQPVTAPLTQPVYTQPMVTQPAVYVQPQVFPQPVMVQQPMYTQPIQQPMYTQPIQQPVYTMQPVQTAMYQDLNRVAQSYNTTDPVGSQA